MAEILIGFYVLGAVGAMLLTRREALQKGQPETLLGTMLCVFWPALLVITIAIVATQNLSARYSAPRAWVIFGSIVGLWIVIIVVGIALYKSGLVNRPGFASVAVP